MTEAELRPTRLGWSALCFLLFAVLAILVVTEWAPLQELDENLGAWPESFTQEHHGLYLFWRSLAIATSTIARWPSRPRWSRSRWPRRSTAARRSGPSA